MADQAASSSNAKKARPRTISTKKIENKNDRMTTFCKRRTGLFRKANEICTLCAVQMALIVISPTNKTYTFAHPNIDVVLDDFLANNRSDANVVPKRAHREHLSRVRNSATVEKLCEKLAKVKNEVNAAAKFGYQLDKIVNGSKNKSWWSKSLGDMNVSELEEYKNAMEELVAAVPACTAGHIDTGSNDMDLELAL
ncbi:hypothetical protein QQ045_017043 [Rhodiola kirilowii]